MKLDDTIHDALAAEPIPTPSAMDLAGIEQAAGKYRRRRLGTRLAAGLGAIALVALAVALWPRPADDVSIRTADDDTAATPTDWATITDPRLGWTMQVPPSWSPRSFQDQCRIMESGTIVRSNGSPPPHDEGPNYCSTEFDWRNVSRDSVLVAVTYRSPRFAPLTSGTTEVPADTSFPLAVGEVGAPVEIPSGTVPAAETSASYLQRWSQRVVLDGDDGYFVTVWFGVDSSEADRGDARVVVASMRPPSDRAPRDPPTAPADPTLRTIALPSLPARGPDDGWMSALARGTLVRAGNCLYLDTPSGTRYVLVFNGPASMTVTDADVVAITVANGSVELELGPIEVAGGEVPWGQLPVENLREECRTEKVWAS